MRVSTGKQAELGDSLEVQQRTINGYALMRGLQVDQTFVEEGVSGSIPLDHRDQGKALLAILRPGDAVIAPKLDRLFRSAADALDMYKKFQEKKIDLHLLDLGGNVMANGVSKLFFTIVSAFAEAERDRHRERMTETRRHLQSVGRYCGGKIPFGYRLVDRGDDPSERYVEPVDAALSALDMAKGMKQSGATLQEIQESMIGCGYKLSIACLHDLLKSVNKGRRAIKRRSG